MKLQNDTTAWRLFIVSSAYQKFRLHKGKKEKLNQIWVTIKTEKTNK